MSAERAFARMTAASMKLGSALSSWQRVNDPEVNSIYVALYGSGEYVGVVWFAMDAREYCWALFSADEPVDGEGQDWEEGP